MKVFQIATHTSEVADNCNEWAEEILAGLWGTNAANLADTNYYSTNGYFYITNYINLVWRGSFTGQAGFAKRAFSRYPRPQCARCERFSD